MVMINECRVKWNVVEWNGEESRGVKSRLGDAAVGGHDEHRREVRLERAVDEREALHVEHVHLVDEEHLHSTAQHSTTAERKREERQSASATARARNR